jgi:5-methylcytosine-specific restriction enzyme subunit McrC
VFVTLREWERLGPDSGSVLANRTLGDDSARKLAGQLTDRIEVLELARGLRVSARQFVGRINLGEIDITVRPKLPDAPLINLLRYAYRLRSLSLYTPVGFGTATESFQDLLVRQLVAEVEELLARGIHREYRRTCADLERPRGRIDFGRLIGMTNWTRASLPCVHHPRADDILLNQAVLAGLAHAVRLPVDITLRAKISRLMQILSLTVSLIKLSTPMLNEAQQMIDRRTVVYCPALRIIGLLLEGEGLSLDSEVDRVRLPGFLFDMNRFFQELVSRFLHDHLEGCEVQDEYRLKQAFDYAPQLNPRNRPAPVIRPDFVIRGNREAAAILDAKYRDLWEGELPPAWLYQVALYALAWKSVKREAVIIYPAVDSNAKEQAIDLQDPNSGGRQARVILRPLDLLDLESLLHKTDAISLRERKALAHRLAFGNG